MDIKEISKADFSLFSSSCECASIYQSVEFTQMMCLDGWSAWYLGGFQEDTLRAATIVLHNRMIGKYQYCCAVKGFLMNYEDASCVKTFSDGICAFLKKRNGLFLRINPCVLYKERDEDANIVNDGFDHSNIVQTLQEAGFVHEGFTTGMDANSHVRWIYASNLENESEATLLKKMSKLTQRNLKTAGKSHIEVKTITRKEDLSIFMDIMDQTAKRRGFSTFSKQYYEHQFDILKDKVKFLYAEFHVQDYLDDLLSQIGNTKRKIAQQQTALTVNKDNEKAQKKIISLEESLQSIHKKVDEARDIISKKGTSFPISTANFTLHQGEIMYFHGGSDETYMHFCGQFTLQWYMMLYGLAHGFKKYNFNGISGIFNKEATDYGVYTFKKGFGGQVEEYIGYFHKPISPFMYSLYRIAAKIKRLVR